MKPLKFSDVVAETAKRSGWGVDVTEALLRMYFKDVRNALTSLSFPQVRVMNLGTFCLKPYAVKKRLEKKECLIEMDGVQNEAVRQAAMEEIEQMREALVVMERERERRKDLNHG